MNERLRVASGLVATAIVSAALTAPAGPAVAGSAAPPATLAIVDQTYAVAAGDTLSLTIGGTLDPAVDTVAVSVHPAVGDLADLDRVVADGPAAALDTVSVAATETRVGGDPVTTIVEVPLTIGTGDDASLDVAGPAILPVTVAARAGDRTVTSATTFVEVVADDSAMVAPLAVVVVAAVGHTGPAPTPEQLTAVGAGVESLVELAAAVDAPLSIALAPSALVAAGASAPATPPVSVPPGSEPADSVPRSGVQLTGAFRGDELLAVPAVDVDPSALVAVDQDQLFTRELRAGEDLVAAAGTLGFVSRAAWLTARPISRPAATMLRDLGSRVLVVTPDLAATLGAPESPTSFDVGLDRGLLPAVSIDPLGELLVAPAGPTAATANERAVRLLAGIVLTTRQHAAPAIVLATPNLGVPDPAITGRLAELASEHPATAIVPLSRLPATVDGAGPGATPSVALPERAGIDLSPRLAAIDDVRSRAAHAAAMLVSSPRPAVWNAEFDTLMSSALDDATITQRLDAVAAEVDGVLASVVPPEPFTFTMTGTSNTLRFGIENTAAEPLTVRVTVHSPKLDIPEPTQLREIPAAGSVEIEVPVEARSNGTFTIGVDLSSPDGYQLDAPVVLKGRVTRVTGLSQVVTGGAVLVLASWWYSHLRKRRRAAATTVAGPAPTEAALAVSPDAAETLADRPRELE